MEWTLVIAALAIVFLRLMTTQLKINKTDKMWVVLRVRGLLITVIQQTYLTSKTLKDFIKVNTCFAKCFFKVIGFF